MRIAVWHNLPSGGGARALDDHISGLRARGHEVDIWTTPFTRQAITPVGGGQARVLPMRMISGLRRWRSLPPAPVAWDRVRAVRRHVRAVAEEINQGNYDVVYAGACQFVRAAPLASYLDMPSVLYLGEPYRWLYEALPEPPFALRHRSRGPFQVVAECAELVNVQARRMQITAEIEASAAYSRVLVNSYFSRESVRRAYGLNSRVCYLGVDTVRFRDLRMNRQPAVVGVGAIVPEKNIEFVVRASSLLGPPAPPVWWIGNVGDPGYAESLHDLAAKRGVELRIETGVTDEELLLRLNTASAMAYAPCLEPFGYAPLEAAACGLPVVGIREGGVRESVTDGVTGYLVDDEQEMAERLAALLEDSQLRARLGEQARSIVQEHWRLDAAVERLEAHLVEAASKA